MNSQEFYNDKITEYKNNISDKLKSTIAELNEKKKYYLFNSHMEDDFYIIIINKCVSYN